VWSLAKRSIEFLAEKKPENPMIDDGEIPAAVKPDTTTITITTEQPDQKEEEIVDNNNDSDEVDEEIHDEEDYDEEMDKEDKSDDKQKKPREEPKEEKHLYANRVKRARKIKENAGKRNMMMSNDNEEALKPDTRMKKRRR